MDLKLPELTELERIIQAGAPWLEARSACNVEFKGRHFPVYVLSIGSKDPSAPAVGFFGGVHGLERIGTRILLAFLRSLLGRLKWDKVLHHQLESVRLIFMPLVNPAGMWNNTRCNTSGVDLMRNAPVDSLEKVPFLLGGQRFSARLPWYRGAADAPMEAEAQALCDVVREELSSRAFSVALDCHSGFGLQDRIWFPFAHSSQPIRHMPQIEALKDLFSQTYADHNYLFEPQSLQYLTHGDLWDSSTCKLRRKPIMSFCRSRWKWGPGAGSRKILVSCFHAPACSTPMRHIACNGCFAAIWSGLIF